MAADTPRQAWICSIGMATAVGDCTAQTETSVRAGISRYASSAIHNRHDRPMTMALLPEDALPQLVERPLGWTSRQLRMLRLGKLALPEALEALPPRQKAALFLAGPEPLPGRSPVVEDGFLDAVCALDPRLERGASLLFATGRAGGMQALDAAMKHLAKNGPRYALLGGIDSYLDLMLLGVLDQDDRVLADGVMNGFAPGEGAGFVLLCSDATRREAHASATVAVHEPGLADEPGHRYSEEPYLGDGLAQAVSAALEGSEEPIGTVLASLNGENFGAKEWGVATVRNSGELGTLYRFEHPGDCFGDIGAAFGPVLIGLAAVGMRRGSLPSPCLVYCSSEAAPRGAVRVTMEPR